MVEKDLYLPVKNLFESLGYEVKGEVREIDVLACKDTEVIAIELKLNITLKLFYQAIQRAKVADFVYVAIPEEALKSHLKQYRSFILMLKRLNLGLIVVKNDYASIHLDPAPYDLHLSKTRSKKKRLKLIEEFKKRASHLEGGMKGKRMTLYLEQSYRILTALSELSEASPKTLIEKTGVQKTPSILAKNYYGWFIRVKRGIYTLTVVGKNAQSSTENPFKKGA